MRETEILKKIQIAATKEGPGKTRLFRNNVGTAWNGQVFYPSTPTTIRVMPGDVVIRRASPIHFGLCAGSSDLIGWHTITIEEQSVGKKLAVFTAIEVKKPGGRKQEAQEHFIDTVQEAGGLAFFATSPEEAVGKMWGGK